MKLALGALLLMLAGFFVTAIFALRDFHFILAAGGCCALGLAFIDDHYERKKYQ